MNPHFTSIRSLRTFLLGACAVLATGCGSATYPVRGQVVFADDKPAVELAGGSVEFELVDGTVSSRGTIEPDATFQLTTYKKNDGAYPGRHRVIVSEPPPPDWDRPPPPIADTKFHSFDESGIVCTVEKRSDNHFIVKVERSKAPPRRRR